ncbi:DNA-binding helix-turn-helix protein [Bordetella bronchiseptica B18-5 (C3)]|uniref:AraC family transcriptional regulator n=1 Tax=Bordetella bronchiseptica TaxID=518 RepID=UPI000460BD19|nr:helix-turn-helix domain-containing protein [Bordetella bronchiseptica]KDB63905.1 DNA-binding helix-turn-helix protein [Bordetella bronchiseptica B18-5 (C3)]KDD83038.1 DNA-binding helix-turn-helix protein [Bordetella bronchiseptica MBORD762]
MQLRRFDSFGEFESAVVDVDLKVRLLGPRDGRWKLGHIDVDGITVQRGVEAVPNLCEASGWPAHLMLLLSAGRPVPTWLNGLPFAEGTAGVLAPGRGFVFRAAGPNEWMTIALPSASSLFEADNETGRVLRSWCQSTRILDAAPFAIGQLRKAALVAADARTPRAAGRVLIEQAVVALAQSSRQPHSAILGRPGISPHAICDAALALLKMMDARRLADLPISSRSQRKFFKQCFGLGPAQYLHLIRLHGIHEALQDVRGSLVSIAETFERHGYPYSAYALARYQAIFGELPSATRKGPKAVR